MRFHSEPSELSRVSAGTLPTEDDVMSGASVFLVEDEALIRMMIAEMLDDLGHRVVAEAGSIEVADPLARSAVFDLGVLDINIGGRNISPIAEIVDGRGLPFIFVSGYGSAGKPVLFRHKAVLRKPFMIWEFGEMIDAALGRQSQGLPSNRVH